MEIVPTSNNKAQIQLLVLEIDNLLNSLNLHQESEWLQEIIISKHPQVKLAQAWYVLVLLVPLVSQLIVVKAQLALRKASKIEWVEDHIIKVTHSNYLQRASNSSTFLKQQTQVI